MPSKKKKYNARFPAGRIKKIMQSDEEIGKVAQAVPVIISKTLELFVESLLNKTLKITNSRNAKTLSTSHMKQCIMAEQRFDFLRELVKNIPDISVAEEAANYNEEDPQSSPDGENYPDSDTPYDLSMPSTSTQATLRPLTTNGDYRQPPATTAHIYAENGAATVRNLQMDEQNRAHLKRDSDIMQRLRQRIISTASPQDLAIPSKSVIMHTTSLSSAHVANECLPPKLYRTDSAPATAAGNNSWQQQQPHPSHLQAMPFTKNLHHHQRQRLKHQSHSLPSSPCGNNGQQLAAASSINQTPPHTPTKQHTLPPIPAPIVSIDFCNKPVVKIDYSNLTLPAKPATTSIAAAPHSAPATVDVLATTANSSGFNFNTEPVINIDLSNIVGSCSATALHKQPAVATISIGNIAAFPANTTNTLVAAPTNSTNNTTNNASCSPALSISVTPAVALPPSAAAKKNNSFFELDEDYDNI